MVARTRGMGGRGAGYVTPVNAPAPDVLSSRAPVGVPRHRFAAIGWGLLAAVGFAVPVTVLALVVRGSRSELVEADKATITAATDVTRAHPGLRSALLVWQEALQPLPVYVVASLVCVLVWWRTAHRARAVWCFLTMMVAWNVALDLKYVVQRVRPVVDDPVSSAPGYSFPSGHVANSAAAGTALLVLLWPLLPGRGARGTAVGVVSLVVVLTALDRVYLGVHYPSDTVAGVLVGSGSVLASWVGFRAWGRRGGRARGEHRGEEQ